MIITRYVCIISEKLGYYTRVVLYLVLTVIDQLTESTTRIFDGGGTAIACYFPSLGFSLFPIHWLVASEEPAGADYCYYIIIIFQG
jgi:hypothetical protein